MRRNFPQNISELSQTSSIINNVVTDISCCMYTQPAATHFSVDQSPRGIVLHKSARIAIAQLASNSQYCLPNFNQNTSINNILTSDLTAQKACKEWCFIMQLGVKYTLSPSFLKKIIPFRQCRGTSGHSNV